jgi:hypothetical protein
MVEEGGVVQEDRLGKERAQLSLARDLQAPEVEEEESWAPKVQSQVRQQYHSVLKCREENGWEGVAAQIVGKRHSGVEPHCGGSSELKTIQRMSSSAYWSRSSERQKEKVQRVRTNREEGRSQNPRPKLWIDEAAVEEQLPIMPPGSSKGL